MKVLYNIFKNFLKNSEHKKYFLIYLTSVMLCYPIESIILPYLTGNLVNILYEKKRY